MGSQEGNNEQRSKLYDKMERDLDVKGLTIPHIGNLSSDIFTIKDGSVTPILRPSKLPVRTNVLYLTTNFSTPISTIVHETFNPHFDKGIWFQNPSLYHFTMFQSSNHMSPVIATEEEVEEEAAAVRAVAHCLCPLKVQLDRVILTSTGVLVGCWQVVSGSDPTAIRSKLRAVLPRAPEKQAYDEAILHTSFARLLGRPSLSHEDPRNELQFIQTLVARVNDKIRGFEAIVSDLWFVEEFDVMALALNGKMKARQFQLGSGGASSAPP